MRYQVFVSSTFSDLVEERREIIHALMKMNCIPAVMEFFPAIDQEQFEFIKKIIDDSDYYILVIGGRYGSLTPQGISYTELEYDYAVSKGIKIITLIHKEPAMIPFGKSEHDPAIRVQLEEFRAKVQKGRLVSFWSTTSELVKETCTSLTQTINHHPAIGWIRGDKAVSQETLQELDKVRRALDIQTHNAAFDKKCLEEQISTLETLVNSHFFTLAKPATPAEIRRWEDGSKANGHTRRVNERRVYYIDSPCIVPVGFGSEAIAVIVGEKVTVFGLERYSHNSIYFMDGYRFHGT